MRYYAIKIDGVDATVFPPVVGALISGAQFSSVAYMQNDPGALRCVFRIELAGSVTQPATSSFVRLYGVTLDMLKQTEDLNGKTIQVYGGMFPGLPLAVEESVVTGTLCCGQIAQAFGNWEGEDMTLDLFIAPGPDTTNASGGGTSDASGSNPAFAGAVASPKTGTQSTTSRHLLTRQSRVGRGLSLSPRGPTASPFSADLFSGIGDLTTALESVASLALGFGAGGWLKTPVNLIHDLQANQPLSDALRTTLTKAFPWATIDVSIHDALKLAYHDAGFYQTPEQLSSYINQLSKSILSSTLSGYLGVDFYVKCETIYAHDGTKQSSAGGVTTLKFQDLIGQPTWAGVNQMNFKSVLRADLFPPRDVVMPDALLRVDPVQDTYGIGNTHLAPHGLSLTFKGQFRIIKVIHVGDSRNPDGGSWCTNVLTRVGGSAEAAAATGAFAGAVAEATSSFFGSSSKPAQQQMARSMRRYPTARLK